MTKSDGGPAFPLHNHGVQTLGMHLTGMTLRDYFAANAMQSLLASIEPGNEHQTPLIPHIAYEMADAMIFAREAK